MVTPTHFSKTGSLIILERMGPQRAQSLLASYSNNQSSCVGYFSGSSCSLGSLHDGVDDPEHLSRDVIQGESKIIVTAAEGSGQVRLAIEGTGVS